MHKDVVIAKKRIILIEDNDADASLIQNALSTSEIDCEVIRFRDGEEALRMLLEEDAQVPDVILLDLNIPKHDGLDVLRRIRNTPRLTYTPVGILTGSQMANDRTRASIIGATCYVQKPASYDEYVRGVRQAVEELISSNPA
jgi:chemotaxis family two-component system response regulator Rcp1